MIIPQVSTACKLREGEQRTKPRVFSRFAASPSHTTRKLDPLPLSNASTCLHCQFLTQICQEPFFRGVGPWMSHPIWQDRGHMKTKNESSVSIIPVLAPVV